MLRLFFVLVFVVALINGQQKPPLSDQITDDEDDLMNDMPQHGLDMGSGMEDLEEPKIEPSKPPMVPKPVPTLKPAPKLEPEVIVEREKVTPMVIKPTLGPGKRPMDDKKMEATSPNPLPATGLGTAAMAGIIAAVIIAIILIIIIIVCCVRKSKRNQNSPHRQQQQQTTRGRQQVPQQV